MVRFASSWDITFARRTRLPIILPPVARNHKSTTTIRAVGCPLAGLTGFMNSQLSCSTPMSTQEISSPSPIETFGSTVLDNAHGAPVRESAYLPLHNCRTRHWCVLPFVDCRLAFWGPSPRVSQVRYLHHVLCDAPGLYLVRRSPT